MNQIKNIIKNNKKILIISLILAIIFNLLTNYAYIISLFNKSSPIIYTLNDITIENNEYTIKNINKDINMIEINFTDIPEKLTISYTSENFQDYNHLNKNYTNDFIKNNKLYVFSSTNGKINNLKLNLNNGIISNIIINPKVKYNLNIDISLLIFIILPILYNLLKRNDKLNLKNYIQRYIMILIFATLISICIGFYLKTIKTVYTFGDPYEYHYVNAIMNGNLHLDYPVDKNLLESANPYDTSNRNFNYLWDSSYYKGKYYCYFGIWPIITIFVPFKLVTNFYLTSPLACLIYSILGIIGTYLLYNAIIKKYFKNISFQTYIISFLFVIFGSKLIWCMHRPSFYEVVSLAAYSHITFGLYLILFKNKRITNFIGYFLLASAVLCRPTSLFASVLILPKIFHNIKNKKWKLLDYIICITPYLVIGLTTMYLNYIRFDSIFEFGVKYQLTINNLYNYKYSILNAAFGTYNYLFDNINMSIFPLNIFSTINQKPFITEYYIENIGGGIFNTSILGIIIFFIPKIFKYIKEKEIKIHIILSLITGFILILLSSSTGALIGRYMLDFNYIFYFVTVILCLYTIKNSKYKNTKNIYIILCTISIIINFLLAGTN